MSEIHHHKPRRRIPSVAVIAERIQAGETTEQIAAELGFRNESLRLKMRTAGLDSDTGLPYKPKPMDPRPALAGFEYTPQDWTEQAGCAGYPSEWWFPETRGGRTDQITSALNICSVCPVRAACLEYALTTGSNYGIYGGMTEDQRAELKKAAS